MRSKAVSLYPFFVICLVLIVGLNNFFIISNDSFQDYKKKCQNDVLEILEEASFEKEFDFSHHKFDFNNPYFQIDFYIVFSIEKLPLVNGHPFKSLPKIIQKDRGPPFIV